MCGGACTLVCTTSTHLYLIYSAGGTHPGDVISIEEHPGDQKKVMWASSHMCSVIRGCETYGLAERKHILVCCPPLFDLGLV